MEVRKAIVPDWTVTRMKRKVTITIFWEMTIESKLLNQFQWSWYHSFEKTMLCLMTSKYAIFSNIKVTKIVRSAFGGTPGIKIMVWRHFARSITILWRVSSSRWASRWSHPPRRPPVSGSSSPPAAVGWGPPSVRWWSRNCWAPRPSLEIDNYTF